MHPPTDPVNIVLVIAGSRGHRLLFRYPFEETTKMQNEGGTVFATGRNPFGLDRSFINRKKPSSSSVLSNGKLFGYPDDILANILTPTSSLCDINFELKIDEVSFVGHPTLVERTDVGDLSIKKETKADLKDDVLLKMFNIVLVMQSGCDQSVISNYHTLSKILANALRHEERRFCFFTCLILK